MNQRLSSIAQKEAKMGYHGFVMGTKPNIKPIISLFPKWDIQKWDNHWCAAFVYYCCIKAGINLPVQYPDERVSNNFAGCNAWEQWAKLPQINIWHDSDEPQFTPEVGDIVLYDRVFENTEHDHIGIVIEVKNKVIVSAEGNFNNVSAVVERDLDEHIRGFIRIEF
ncbi:MAG: CHAP domain-containing protein [Clostridium sp.]